MSRSKSVAKARRALVSSQNPYWSVVSGARHDDSGDKTGNRLDPVQELTSRMNSCAEASGANPKGELA